MAIGANWKEVWAAVWGPVWTLEAATPPAEITSIRVWALLPRISARVTLPEIQAGATLPQVRTH